MEVKIAYGNELLPDAHGIREDVFVREQGFHNEFDEIDAVAWHTVIYDNGRPAATGRAFLEDGAWHIGRVAVRKEFRGKQYGASVMQALERKMMVPAFLTKALARSHMWMATPFRLGQW